MLQREKQERQRKNGRDVQREQEGWKEAIAKRNAQTSKASLTVYKTVRAKDSSILGRHNDNVSGVH